MRGSKQFGWSVPWALKGEDLATGLGALRNRGKRGAKSSAETGKGGEGIRGRSVRRTLGQSG